MPCGSEPVSASVKAMLPSFSPRAKGDKSLFFCSSLPKRKIASSGTVFMAIIAPTVIDAWQSCSSASA